MLPNPEMQMVEIRPCRNDDFNGVLKLLSQLWPENNLETTSLRTVFELAITSNLQIFICASSVDKIIGFGSLTIINSLWQAGYLGHVDELVVDAEYRGRGIGTQLLEHLVDLAKKHDCRRIELDSAFHRRDAHRFYEQNGFVNRGYLFSKVL